MELKITKFFNEAAPRDYAASAAELGQDAGRITWRHAVEDSAEFNLLDTDEKREAFRAFVKSSGGWNDEEIAAWSDIELNALCIQWIAGDIREAGLDTEYPDRDEYESDDQAGRNSGRIFRGIDGEIYFYCGS